MRTSLVPRSTHGRRGWSHVDPPIMTGASARAWRILTGRWQQVAMVLLGLAMAAVTLGLLLDEPGPAGASEPIVSGSTLSVCNDEQNAPGQGVRCDISIDHYLDETGAIYPGPLSAWTVTRCTGTAAGLFPDVLDSATCETTTGATTEQPITTVRACNGSGNGADGGVGCAVMISNYYIAAPIEPILAATVYQCGGDPPVPDLLCAPSPVANTAPSIAEATVGQCNESGLGGLTAAAEGSAHCIVDPGSTTTATLPMHVDQCNGSANGGGAAHLGCTAWIVNDPLARPGTPAGIPLGTPPGTPPTADPPPPAPAVPALAEGVPGPAPTGAGGLVERHRISVPWLLGALTLGLLYSARSLGARRRLR